MELIEEFINNEFNYLDEFEIYSHNKKLFIYH